MGGGHFLSEWKVQITLNFHLASNSKHSELGNFYCVRHQVMTEGNFKVNGYERKFPESQNIYNIAYVSF